MCTVVCHHDPDAGVRILALRDEFTDRDFDDPGRWWPEQPDVVGGRDRTAGGSWCVTDVRTGVTALLVNRTERFVGTPSRGLLPLAALAHGAGWVDVLEHRTMAAFTLVLAGADGVTVWIWDAVELRRVDLAAGTHVVTSRGVDADDAKTQRFAPVFASADAADWTGVVGACEPSSADSALVVRRQYGERTYATVFGQLLSPRAGVLDVESSRTPWRPQTWSRRSWVLAGEDLSAGAVDVDHT